MNFQPGDAIRINLPHFDKLDLVVWKAGYDGGIICHDRNETKRTVKTENLTLHCILKTPLDFYLAKGLVKNLNWNLREVEKNIAGTTGPVNYDAAQGVICL